MQALLGHDPSLAPLKQLLIERTAGNPFFLEETVRTLVETQVLVGAPGAYRLARDLPTIQVPATVQAVLAARIDRLPLEAKHLLQTAAVIGHEVPLALLQAIADCSEEALHRSLTQLQGAEFLYETRLFPEREYTFKHALTHEVAYSSLLQERRRVLHARIVAALEELYADRLAEQVDRLAHHALRGEVWDKAVAYCRQAGARAIDPVGVSRGGDILRAGAERAATSPSETGYSGAGHRSPPRPAQCALPSGRDRADIRLPAGSPNPRRSPGRSPPAGVGLCLSAHYFMQTGEPDSALASGQRALAIAVDLGDVGLTVTAQTTWGRSTAAWEIIVGQWSASKRMWRVSMASYSMSALA